MKYDVIQNADGNTSIVSTWVNNINGARQSRAHQIDILYGDKNTTKAVVGIFDENLDVVDNKEYIDKTVPVTAIYSVDFNSHGGSEIPSQFVNEGNKVVEPDDPTRDGYIFVCWELDGYVYDFNSIVNGNMVLVATWEPEPQSEPEA